MTETMILETEIQTTETYEYEQNNDKQNTAANFPQTPQSREALQSRADDAAYGTTVSKSEPCKSSAKTEATKAARGLGAPSAAPASPSAPLPDSSDSADSKSSNEERKERTRKLINMGGLIVKAELEVLPSNTLYGGLLSLRNQLLGKNRDEMYEVIDRWTYLGKQQFAKEMRKGDCVALRFNVIPPREMLDKIKSLGLKWNGLRKEWEGTVSSIDTLKTELGSADYSLQTL